MERSRETILLIRPSVCIPNLFLQGMSREWEIPLSRVKRLSARKLLNELIGDNGCDPFVKKELLAYLRKLKAQIRLAAENKISG